jgi:DNA-binding transcriptional regulator YdaS (Cro superfamily)
MSLTQKDGLRILIKTMGSSRALAEVLKISHQAVLQWRKVPAERLLDIERLTGVPRAVLRPDLYEPSEPPVAVHAAPDNRAKPRNKGRPAQRSRSKR